MMSKVMIIVNPGSGDNQGEEQGKRLADFLNGKFDQVDIKKTEGDNDALKFAQEACQGHYDSLFTVGGDGTINEAVNGLAGQDYRPTLGFFPAGTNNTFAQLFNISEDIDQYIENLDLEESHRLDIGRCNDQYFNYYVCFGKLIEATTGTSSEEKSQFGSFAYLKNILSALPKDDTHPIKIESDSESFEGKASHVFVLLTNQVGNLVFSNEQSNLQDGQFQVYILTDESTGSKLSALKDILFGQLEDNDSIKSFACSKLTITNSDDNETQVDIDGNDGPYLPCEIELLPKHINFYVPKTQAVQ